MSLTPPRQILNRRQIQILRLFARGLSRKEAASAIGISRKTVEYHCKLARERTWTVSDLDTVLWCIKRRLIKL